MGTGMIWNCDRCELDGHEKSGVGFAGIHVEPVWCAECGELQDRMARYKFDDAPDGFEFQKNCAECGTRLTKLNSKKPCPKCGEEKLAGMAEVLWD
jgi:predicted RNA-binding Zn-ribbon protein involved in translation (DUF1610 family)